MHLVSLLVQLGVDTYGDKSLQFLAPRGLPMQQLIYVTIYAEIY